MSIGAVLASLGLTVGVERPAWESPPTVHWIAHTSSWSTSATPSRRDSATTDGTAARTAVCGSAVANERGPPKPAQSRGPQVRKVCQKRDLMLLFWPF